MNWTRLAASSPHEGRILPEVFFRDPEFVISGVEHGAFVGALRAEAEVVVARARCIAVRREDDQGSIDLVVLHHLLANGHYGGVVIVPATDPKIAAYRQHAAAESLNRLDLTLPRRLAPDDRGATRMMLGAVLFHLLGDSKASLSDEEAIGFFDDEESFLPIPSRRLRLYRVRGGLTPIALLVAEPGRLLAETVLQADPVLDSILGLATPTSLSRLSEALTCGTHVLVADDPEDQHFREADTIEPHAALDFLAGVREGLPGDLRVRGRRGKLRRPK